MIVTYKVVKETHMINDSKRVSYGIEAYDGTKHDTINILKYIGDISHDKEKIEKLVQLCNQSRLSNIHLYDVVEDFLTI